jgi:hypothetical protein
MEDDARVDENLESAVDRALAPYLSLLPQEQLEELRDILRDELSRHPVSARLLKQLAPPPVVQASDDLVRDDPLAAEAPSEDDAKVDRGGSR